MGMCVSQNSTSQYLNLKPKEKQSKEPEKAMAPAPTPVKASKNKAAAELRAAILIQKWYRKWDGKLRARRELVWHIFQKVEYLGERNQMMLNKFFRTLIEEFSKSSEHKPEMDCANLIEDAVQLTDIPPGAAVNVNAPFSVDNLKELMNFFKTGKVLDTNCVINLLIMTNEKLKAKANLNEISTSVTKKITIVGDLHGNLDDLLTIFFKNEVPSVSNPYVFNGDFVDRGKKSVEVTMLLCYAFLLFPNHVHLNRGNHEDPDMNEKYGLLTELKTKYKAANKPIFKLFKNFYRYLPLGTIIDRRVFVVHGGIGETTDLNRIGDIKRSRFNSVIKPPRNVAEGNLEEWEQMTDLLWSDPAIEKGCLVNENRGGGKCFGSDVTDKFLHKHKMDLLIRSHECKSEGYEYSHSNKVLTIFSSSNYYDPGSNKGAYIIYKGDVKKVQIVQFICSDESMKNVNFKESIVSLEDRAISDLKRTMNTYHVQLTKRFLEVDRKRKGVVTIDQYAQILSDVLGMNLPWRLVQPKISLRDKNNLVLYETTFQHTKEDGSGSDILLNNLEILETIFRAIDKDNSGLITMEEFSDAMDILKSHSDLDTNDIRDLGTLIDSDNDGFIDIDEFFEAFKLSSW